jgi:hypothetical protein
LHDSLEQSRADVPRFPACMSRPQVSLQPLVVKLDESPISLYYMSTRNSPSWFIVSAISWLYLASTPCQVCRRHMQMLDKAGPSQCFKWACASTAAQILRKGSLFSMLSLPSTIPDLDPGPTALPTTYQVDTLEL